MNRNYRILLISGFLVGAAFFLSSCKSTKPLVYKPLPEMSFSQLSRKMEAGRPSFSYLSAKLGVSYEKEGKEPVQFRAQMRLKKDSIIWMSIVPAMGIEAARVVITNDSVKLLNRMKKNYVLGTFSLLDSLMHTDINYAMLQSLLLGNSVSYPLTDSSASIDNRYYLLSMKMPVTSPAGHHLLTQKIWLNPQTFTIKELYLSESGLKDKNIRVFYDTYQTIDGKTIPLKMQIVIRAEQKITININYKRTDVDIPRKFPFIVPGKYKKLIEK